jgi:chorismate mutase / prephenate dehydratase
MLFHCTQWLRGLKTETQEGKTYANNNTSQRLSMLNTRLSPENEALLQQYRQRIDSIDDELVALLKQRIQLVHQVGELKQQDLNTNCFIRPGREADIIRRIYADFAQTEFDPMAAALIWRQIIAASTNLEQKLKISYYTTDLNENFIGDFFSTILDYQPVDSSIRALNLMLSGETTVAVIPYATLVQDSVMDFLMQNPGYKAFVGLPFIQRDNAPHPRLVAIAAVPPEQTTDDHFLLAISSPHPDPLGEALKSGYPQGQVLRGQGKWLLLDAPGFDPRGDTVLQGLQEAPGSLISSLHWLGCYATPIRHNPR